VSNEIKAVDGAGRHRSAVVRCFVARTGWPGQPSSICWVADISIACAACILKAAPAAAGSRATDTAIRIANMVRPTAIALLSHAKYPAPPLRWSNDEIESFPRFINVVGARRGWAVSHRCHRSRADAHSAAPGPP